MQVLTTVFRFLDEEQRQIAMPVAQRSASAFGDLADSISADSGVNGSGTLQVSLGAGSAATPTQVAFSATVASRYASTTLAVWDVRVTSHGGIGENAGACVLWSTLLGPGRATTALNLGGGERAAGMLTPVVVLWSGGRDAAAPGLGWHPAVTEVGRVGQAVQRLSRPDHLRDDCVVLCLTLGPRADPRARARSGVLAVCDLPRPGGGTAL
jgi:hypothetical protein